MTWQGLTGGDLGTPHPVAQRFVIQLPMDVISMDFWASPREDMRTLGGLRRPLLPLVDASRASLSAFLQSTQRQGHVALLCLLQHCANASLFANCGSAELPGQDALGSVPARSPGGTHETRPYCSAVQFVHLKRLRIFQTKSNNTHPKLLLAAFLEIGLLSSLNIETALPPSLGIFQRTSRDRLHPHDLANFLALS